MGRALFAAGLSLVLAGLGHVFLGLWRGLWFAVPSMFLLYLYWMEQWEYAMQPSPAFSLRTTR